MIARPSPFPQPPASLFASSSLLLLSSAHRLLFILGIRSILLPIPILLSLPARH